MIKTTQKKNNQKTKKKTTIHRHNKLIHLYNGKGDYPTYLKVIMPKIEDITREIKSNPKKTKPEYILFYY